MYTTRMTSSGFGIILVLTVASASGCGVRTTGFRDQESGLGLFQRYVDVPRTHADFQARIRDLVYNHGTFSCVLVITARSSVRVWLDGMVSVLGLVLL
jgi:hypothetical protein